MNKIKRNIPNAITCGNLLCGCLALILIFKGDLICASFLVGAALVLDFFDGFTARLLGVSSPIGKDLDSLADMVTFGVVPGMMMFKLISRVNTHKFIDNFSIETINWDGYNSLEWIKYLALIIPIFSAIRLAKFNNDTRQSDSFIGVPTPANAMVVCSIPLIFWSSNEHYFSGHKNMLPSSWFAAGTLNNKIAVSLTSVLESPYVLVAIAIVFSFLLVAELPLFALKFKHFKWKGNEIRFSFLLVSLLLLVILKYVSIPLIIVFYILISIINNLLTRGKNTMEIKDK